MSDTKDKFDDSDEGYTLDDAIVSITAALEQAFDEIDTESEIMVPRYSSVMHTIGTIRQVHVFEMTGYGDNIDIPHGHRPSPVCVCKPSKRWDKDLVCHFYEHRNFIA